jgi:hypothetical protein
MKDSYSPLLGVDQNNREAIGSLDAKKNARRGGDEAIPDQGLFRHAVNTVNEVGMNLAQGDQRPRPLACGGSELPQESLSIAFDRADGILLGEAEVETAPAISV